MQSTNLLSKIKANGDWLSRRLLHPMWKSFRRENTLSALSMVYLMWHKNHYFTNKLYKWDIMLETKHQAWIQRDIFCLQRPIHQRVFAWTQHFVEPESSQNQGHDACWYVLLSCFSETEKIFWSRLTVDHKIYSQLLWLKVRETKGRTHTNCKDVCSPWNGTECAQLHQRNGIISHEAMKPLLFARTDETDWPLFGPAILETRTHI